MLPHHIDLFVPHTFNATVPADSSWELRKRHADILRRVKTHMAKHFGGFTSVPAVGGWHSDEHGLIEEPITIVGGAHDDSTAHHVPSVFEPAKRVAREMGQEAVAVRHNGVMHFITPDAT